jgi:hypothetical protein
MLNKPKPQDPHKPDPAPNVNLTEGAKEPRRPK